MPYDAAAIGELLIDFACAAAGLSAAKPGGVSGISEYDTVMECIER